LQVDGFIDALAQPVADLHILRSEPAPDAAGLQIGMQTTGQRLILAGVRDE